MIIDETLPLIDDIHDHINSYRNWVHLFCVYCIGLRRYNLPIKSET